MSAEAEETKPKLNITINYEGNPITVKVKANMQFKKIFEVAEQKFGKESGTFKFVFEGERVLPQDTPAGRGMEDGDVIDAHLEQLGGALKTTFL
ncbi:ubiquitin-related domain-containing protein [Amylostereum chailletii]|nr:ubiquitin-related domain-containing protein [Amylostereum chailletii]